MKKKMFLVLGMFMVFQDFVSSHVGDDFYNHHNYMMGNYGYSIFGSFISLLIITALILLIIWLTKKIKNEDKIARRLKKK